MDTTVSKGRSIKWKIGPIRLSTTQPRPDIDTRNEKPRYEVDWDAVQATKEKLARSRETAREHTDRVNAPHTGRLPPRRIPARSPTDWSRLPVTVQRLREAAQSLGRTKSNHQRNAKRAGRARARELPGGGRAQRGGTGLSKRRNRSRTTDEKSRTATTGRAQPRHTRRTKVAHENTPVKKEVLVLPEPGRSLLRAAYPVLTELIPSRQNEAGFTIGGGTILAARWGHRDSKDIDVRINNSHGMGLLTRMDEEPFIRNKVDRAMHKAGAQGRKRPGPGQLLYIFGNVTDPKAPVLDLSEFPPRMKGELVWIESEGRTFWGSSTTEILAGKWLGRREDPPVRDVFDLAVAGWADGPALQRAMSTAGDWETIDRVVETLAMERDSLQKEARDEIEGVPEYLEVVRQDPAQWAANAIGLWTPQTVTLKCEGQDWAVTTTCQAQDGCLQGRYQDVEQAGEIAAALGGLNITDTQALKQAATETGVSTAEGSRRRMKKVCAPVMRISGDGSVEIANFAEETETRSSIEEAIDVAIERGWCTEQERDVQRELLQAQQREAIGRERG